MSPRNQPPGDEKPAARITAGLFKLALVLRHQGWKAAGERGLTPTQSQILALLGSIPGEVGVKVLAEQLSITMGTASAAVSTLERKGLLNKARSRFDGRAVVLKLTARGRREARKAQEWPEVLVEAAEALPPTEQAGLVRGLVGMIRELQERGAVPTSRMCVGCRYFRPNEAPGSEKPHYCEYLDAAIADVDLRFDCAEMEPAPEAVRPRLLEALFAGTSLTYPHDTTN